MPPHGRRRFRLWGKPAGDLSHGLAGSFGYLDSARIRGEAILAETVARRRAWGPRSVFVTGPGGSEEWGAHLDDNNVVQPGSGRMVVTVVHRAVRPDMKRGSGGGSGPNSGRIYYRGRCSCGWTAKGYRNTDVEADADVRAHIAWPDA